MHWFGTPWPSEAERAPVCSDDSERVNTPVGVRCLWCEEVIVDGDRGTDLAVYGADGPSIGWAHIECQMRQGTGGPAHLLGICNCGTGGSEPDMGMTARQAALWVWDYITAG